MMSASTGVAGDPLCRFYTRPHVGDALVGLFGRSREPARVLDLACGGGALSFAAARRWRDAEYVTVDIDPAVAIGARAPRRRLHLVADALDDRLPELIPGAGFDIALCNPPYALPRWRPGFERILGEAGLADAVRPAMASADVLFIAQSLRLARLGGRVGLLVPDGLVTGRRSEPFRAALLRNHRVETVVQLQPGAFAGTEARAFVLILTKGAPGVAPIALRRMGVDAIGSSLRMVAPDAARHRLDHDFHVAAGAGCGPTLRDLGAEIVRGGVESPAAAGFPVFHTTHFPTGDARMAVGLPVWHGCVGRLSCAEPGDILLARVDRALHRKVCGIAAGRMPLSASVLRLRMPPGRRDEVLGALLSPAGEARLAATARGVGARMLGREDLLTMCLPI